jgi:hypothetical protein
MNIQSFSDMHQLMRSRTDLPILDPADIHAAHVALIAKLILGNLLILAELLDSFPKCFKKFLVFGFHGYEFPHRSKSVVTYLLQYNIFIH